MFSSYKVKRETEVAPESPLGEWDLMPHWCKLLRIRLSQYAWQRRLAVALLLNSLEP